jgi:hypothetical protein
MVLRPRLAAGHAAASAHADFPLVDHALRSAAMALAASRYEPAFFRLAWRREADRHSTGVFI